MLEVYDRRGREYIRTLRHLVLGHGFHIFQDVADRGRVPPASRRNEPQVAHAEWDPRAGAYRLFNDDSGSWRGFGVGSGLARVGHGESVLLDAGRRVLLGEDRLLAVREPGGLR